MCWLCMEFCMAVLRGRLAKHTTQVWAYVMTAVAAELSAWQQWHPQTEMTRSPTDVSQEDHSCSDLRSARDAMCARRFSCIMGQHDAWWGECLLSLGYLQRTGIRKNAYRICIHAPHAHTHTHTRLFTLSHYLLIDSLT